MMGRNIDRYSTGQTSDGGGFAPYAAGNKHYGGGRNNPTMGPVDRTGYIERDAAIRARRNAILMRLRGTTGQYIQPGNIR